MILKQYETSEAYLISSESASEHTSSLSVSLYFIVVVFLVDKVTIKG